MKFDNTQVYNIENAIYGIRNSYESWAKSDELGTRDLALAESLADAGSSHRKFLRQILVSVDITAPAYWWAEFDTYKVGVTRNSTSMQHRAMYKTFLLDDFELDETVDQLFFSSILTELNRLRELYAETNDYGYFRAIRQILPSSYKYLSTVTMNYEVIRNMYEQRKNHKLIEWSIDFTHWVEGLPYAKELLIR